MLGKGFVCRSAGTVSCAEKHEVPAVNDELGEMTDHHEPVFEGD